MVHSKLLACTIGLVLLLTGVTLTQTLAESMDDDGRVNPLEDNEMDFDFLTEEVPRRYSHPKSLDYVSEQKNGPLVRPRRGVYDEIGGSGMEPMSGSGMESMGGSGMEPMSGSGMEPEMNCTRSTTLIPISNSLISLEVIWPTSLYNTTSTAQCPCSRNGSMQYAFRVCHLNGTWGEPDLAQCNISSTNSICALDMTLDHISSLTVDELQVPTTQEMVLDILDNILGSPSTFLNEANNQTSSNNEIRQIFQNLGTALNISTGEEVTLIGANYLLNVQQVNTSQPMFTGFERLYNQTSNTSVAQTGGGGDGIPEAVMVSIPAAVFRQVSQQMNQTDVRVVVVRYGNTRLFTDTQSMRAVTSSVLSVSFGIRLTNLSNADSIRINFAKSQIAVERGFNVSCVFWDDAANNGIGGWSSEGLMLVNETREEVFCVSEHLTEFTILQNIVEPSEPTLVYPFLTPLVIVLSITGVVFFVACTSTLLIVFLRYCYRKRRHRKKRFIDDNHIVLCKVSKSENWPWTHEEDDYYFRTLSQTTCVRKTVRPALASPSIENIPVPTIEDILTLNDGVAGVPPSLRNSALSIHNSVIKSGESSGSSSEVSVYVSSNEHLGSDHDVQLPESTGTEDNREEKENIESANIVLEDGQERNGNIEGANAVLADDQERNGNIEGVRTVLEYNQERNGNIEGVRTVLEDDQERNGNIEGANAVLEDDIYHSEGLESEFFEELEVTSL